MGKCLKTQLKEIVNNDNLVTLGKLTLLHSNTSNYSVFILGVNDINNPCTIEIIKGESHIKGGGSGYDTATDFGTSVQCVHPTGQLFYITPGANTVIYIDNVENIKILEVDFSAGGALSLLNNLSGLSQLKNLLSLTTQYYNGSFDVIKNNIKSALTNFSAGNTNISGKLSSFNDMINLSKLEIHHCPNIQGKIQDIGSLINLENVRLYGNTNIDGSFEAFVAAQRTARVAAGLPASNSTGINFGYIHQTKITFDGSIVSNVGDSPTLTWTEDTIRLKNNTGYDVTVNA